MAAVGLASALVAGSPVGWSGAAPAAAAPDAPTRLDGAAAAVAAAPVSVSYTAPVGGATVVTRKDYDVSQMVLKPIASAIVTSGSFTNDPNGSIQWPFAVGVPVGDRFGPRSCEGCTPFHHGTDFNPGNGAPIQSIAAGTVREVNNGDGQLGVHVIIDHEIDGRLISSLYAHMQHGSVALTEGQEVRVGQFIGLVGSTGYSTGPHLHFGILLNGTDAVDSYAWLQQNAN